jgi:flagellar hook assembly protein FlgD
VRLEVLDTSGRRVRTLVDGDRDAGRHAARWDGENDAGNTAAPGVYFVRLSAGADAASLRILKLH